MTDSWLITGARPLGGEPANVLVTDGMIAELGPERFRALVEDLARLERLGPRGPLRPGW